MRTMMMLGLGVATFVFDQWSKVWALNALSAHPADQFELAPFVTVVRAYNKGVNFGLFASDSDWQPLALAGLAVVISVAVFIWGLRAADRRIALGAGLLIGGALGNATDRLHFGAVFDFINMDCCGIGNPFAFNVADVAIFAGAIAILWASWRETPESNA